MNPARSLHTNRKPKEPFNGPVRLRVHKRQLVRDAIWDAAIDLFAEKGFDETTIDDIASAAGVSRRSFFRYFSSKSDLMAHGIVSYGTTLTDAILACPPAYSLPEVFRATVLQVSRDLATQPRTPKIMEIVERYPAAREAQVSRMAEIQDKVAAAFAQRTEKRGKRRGSRYDLTANLLAALTISTLGVTFRAWFADGPEDISATVKQVLATLGQFAGIGD